jgi:hypothetical protein
MILSSPVWLYVTSPAGGSITPTINTILSESTYNSTSDYNSGLKDDELVTIPQPRTGAYHIRVERKSVASDRFTLASRIDGNQMQVLEDYECAKVSELGTTIPDTARFTLSVQIDGNHQLFPEEFRDATVTSLDSASASELVYFASTVAPGNVDGRRQVTSAQSIYSVNYTFKSGLMPCSVSPCGP